MSDYTNIDNAIPSVITGIRDEHHACTARMVAQRMRVSPDVVRGRLQKMKDAGVVTWTDVPGSLRVLAASSSPVESVAESPAQDAPAKKAAAPKRRR